MHGTHRYSNAFPPLISFFPCTYSLSSFFLSPFSPCLLHVFVVCWICCAFSLPSIENDVGNCNSSLSSSFLFRSLVPSFFPALLSSTHGITFLLCVTLNGIYFSLDVVFSTSFGFDSWKFARESAKKETLINQRSN